MITYRTLTHVGLPVLHRAFLGAFSTYFVPVNDSLADFEHLLERRGADLSLSLGAFADEKLVGFIVNGVGLWRRKKTAYDTVTGILPGYQKKGIARRLFEHLFPLLTEHDIEQYLLEVIQSNTAAVRLYKRMGFDVTREYRCFQADKHRLNAHSAAPPDLPCSLAKIGRPAWDTLRTFWDFPPSWQNAVEAIERTPNRFKIWGAYRESACIGYGVVEVASGDVPQLAVRKDHRRQGIGTALLARLAADCRKDTLKMINVEKSDTTTGAFLRARGFDPTVDQYEMLRPLQVRERDWERK